MGVVLKFPRRPRREHKKRKQPSAIWYYLEVWIPIVLFIALMSFLGSTVLWVVS